MRTMNIDRIEGIDLRAAERIARDHATDVLANPTVLSWYDRQRDESFPPEACCSEQCEPGWLVYGQFAGGSLKVDIGEDYSFIMKEG